MTDESDSVLPSGPTTGTTSVTTRIAAMTTSPIGGDEAPLPAARVHVGGGGRGGRAGEPARERQGQDQREGVLDVGEPAEEEQPHERDPTRTSRRRSRHGACNVAAPIASAANIPAENPVSRSPASRPAQTQGVAARARTSAVVSSTAASWNAMVTSAVRRVPQRSSTQPTVTANRPSVST